MSGTSLDGVDAVLVDFTNQRTSVLGHCSTPFSPELKAELMALNAVTSNELHRAALAANALVRTYAKQVHRLLTQCHVTRGQIRAIGAHGQTVRHCPQEFDGTGYSLQLNNPALLAELCTIDVVADFRSRDVCAGGQGAPLVPPFHQAFFGQPDQLMAVLNIGGISNITVLNPQSPNSPDGFDCGPGNAMLDAWSLQHIGQPYDASGQWAAQGQVHTGLLQRMLEEPYFSKPPPKSTGRDLFNPLWLANKLQGFGTLPPVDVQTTLTELTALTCARSLQDTAPTCRTLYVCGGGAYNLHLMERLQTHLSAWRVQSSELAGLPPLQVEATAFAWLAMQCVQRKTANVPKVTGAKGARILGAIYPA
jgi:anhydro-N-acetylmuramic acid kinase